MYLLGESHSATPAGQRFRDMVRKGEILGIPGTHNGLCSLQAKRAGFKAVYLSGAAVSASMGLPDLGILTIEDMAFYIRQVSRASGLPVLVDGDTGYGEALNVMNMVRCFEDAGAGAVHLEDQILPKKCGHLSDKKLASKDDMAAKVAAAARARRHLYIIARTDAAASEGLDGAVERAKAYLAAGADAIFAEAAYDLGTFEKFAKAAGVPLLANITEFGKTPLFSVEELKSAGVGMVLYPLSAFRAMNKAAETVYQAVRRDGHQRNVVDMMQTRDELYDRINYHEFEGKLDVLFAQGKSK